MKRVVKITPSFESTVIKIDSLEDMQQAVCAPGETDATVECVHLGNDLPNVMYVNEDGRSKGHLPNILASFLAQKMILGTVIVMGEVVGGDPQEVDLNFMQGWYPELLDAYEAAA